MTIEEIKATFRLRDTVEGYGIEIMRNGFCRCPFHQGDRTPSMKLYPNNTYHCFGCGADGDVISFVMRMDGIGFQDACRKLSGEGLSKGSRRHVALSEMKRRARNEAANRRKDALNTLNHRISHYRDKIRSTGPETASEGIPDEMADAIMGLANAEHMVDLIMEGLYEP